MLKKRKYLVAMVTTLAVVGVVILLTDSYGLSKFQSPLKVHITEAGLGNYNGNKQPAIEILYYKRTQDMKETCMRQNTPHVSHFDLKRMPLDLKVDLKHKLLYCNIPKVGSTFWLRTLEVMKHPGKKDTPYGMHLEEANIPNLKNIQRHLNTSELDILLNKSMSFLFVRDPYERLFSAYVNKLYQPNIYFWKGIGTQIVKLVRKNATREGLRLGHDVTFAEYVEYIILELELGHRLNGHFAPMNEKCDPCTMPYDFIGKMETFHQDAVYLLNRWKTEYRDFNVNIFGDFGKEQAADDTGVGFLFGAKSHTEVIHYPFYRMVLRIWSALQIRGLLSKDIDFPLTNRHEKVRNLTAESLQKLIVEALNVSVERRLVKLQRDEALVQAYRSVSMTDMVKLRHFVLKDCQLFGYDDRPAKLFDRSLPYIAENEHLYMVGL